MDKFQSLNAEERELVVSLPYRVGVWISLTDDVESGEDDGRESHVLTSVLQSMAKRTEKMPFTAAVLAETLSAKDRWKAWEDCNFQVPDDCRRAMALLQPHLDKTEFQNYRVALMQVAKSIAHAASELADGYEYKDSGSFLGKIASFFEKMGDSGKADPMNVSAAEDAALQELAEALRPQKNP